MNKILLVFLICTRIAFGQTNFKIDSLEKVILKKTSDTILISNLCLLSKEYADFDLQKSISLANRALKISLKKTNKRFIANSYHRLAAGYFYSGILDSSLYFNKKALAIREVLNNKKDLGASYSNLANLYTELGNYKEALMYHQRCIDVDLFFKDKYSLGGSYGDMGIAYEKMGDFNNSITCYLKSLKIAQELKDERGICFNYINLGVLYHLTNNKLQTLECYNKCLTLAKKLNNKLVEARALNGLGQLYIELTDAENNGISNKTTKYQKAINVLKESLKISKNIPDEYQISVCYSALGNTYLAQLKNEQKTVELFNIAESYLDSNLLLVTKLNSVEQIPIALSSLGDLYIEKGDLTKAEKYELEALKKANEVGAYDIKITILNHLYKIYKLQGKPNLALTYYKSYIEFKDSVYGVETQSTILKQQLNFDFEKKQLADSLKTEAEKKYTFQLNESNLSKERNQKLLYASLALLALLSVGFLFYQYKLKQKTNAQLYDINDKINKQNNTLKTLNKELIESEDNLQKSNSTKEQLISMMSHDLLNPITAITNYNQQIISSKTTNEDLLSAFKNVDAAIQPMHSLLDNMLQWSAIQKDGVQAKLKQQDVNDIVKEIIAIYRPQATLKFIKLIDAFDKDFVLNTDKSILSLILRNLLNNAIKYSSNNTQILIATNSVTKTITITDQGFGMTDEMINYLNTKQLNKLQSKGTGLGLKLCFEFAEAIGASIKFYNNYNNGTIVTISLLC